MRCGISRMFLLRLSPFFRNELFNLRPRERGFPTSHPHPNSLAINYSTVKQSKTARRKKSRRRVSRTVFYQYFNIKSCSSILNLELLFLLSTKKPFHLSSSPFFHLSLPFNEEILLHPSCLPLPPPKRKNIVFSFPFLSLPIKRRQQQKKRRRRKRGHPGRGRGEEVGHTFFHLRS